MIVVVVINNLNLFVKQGVKDNVCKQQEWVTKGEDDITKNIISNRSYGSLSDAKKLIWD
jgi:hypothetical protein